MIATITNAAMVPPKLMPGVSRNPGVYSGNSAEQAEADDAEDPLLRPARDRPTTAAGRHPGASRRCAVASSTLLVAHARAFPRLSPSMPVGRISSTRTSSTNATTSRHWVPNTACP